MKHYWIWSKGWSGFITWFLLRTPCKELHRSNLQYTATSFIDLQKAGTILLILQCHLLAFYLLTLYIYIGISFIEHTCNSFYTVCGSVYACKTKLCYNMIRALLYNRIMCLGMTLVVQMDPTLKIWIESLKPIWVSTLILLFNTTWMLLKWCWELVVFPLRSWCCLSSGHTSKRNQHFSS